MYHTSWMKPDKKNGLSNDPCAMNPINCTDGISFSIWEQLSYPGDVIGGSGDTSKRYIISTGGDYDPVSGIAWPGIAIYNQGPNVVGLVSTGYQVFELPVSGQLYNNSWTEIGLRFIPPNLANPLLANTDNEDMGGLEMFINGIKVGQTILSDATARGSTTWLPQPPLTSDGTPNGKPVMMLGCHQNSALQAAKQFTGFAGRPNSPVNIDEVVVWRHRLAPYEQSYFLGGYNSDTAGLNANQLGAMLGGVDLTDPIQAAAAQAVLQAMLMGPPKTTPALPTRTAPPTMKKPATTPSGLSSTSTTTAASTSVSPDKLRSGILSKQAVISSMLKTAGATQGQDPEDVQGRFSMAAVASAIFAGTDENVNGWGAVEQAPQYEGAQKTVREMEQYMLTWVGSVNTSAYRPHDAHWKTPYFDPGTDSMRYATKADGMVLNVDKLPISALRADGAIRRTGPDYSGWEWAEAKAKWETPRDNFSIPTGMFINYPKCSQYPLTILTGVYNGLPDVTSLRRNPVNIRSHHVKIDSKVISIRVALNPDPMLGDTPTTYGCPIDPNYMAYNPVRVTFWHREPARAKRSLVWHTDEYWTGVEVRHCVWWNQNFGINGAWDDTGCKVTMTSDDHSTCECAQFGSLAIMVELIDSPVPVTMNWYLLIKWIGIITGTILLTIFVAVVFLSVVVGEMFHQIRMWCCLSYMIANILMLISDTPLCDDRHTNLALAISLIFFFQASMCWNMCEAHATFRGITLGLINGRTSVYHPIAWGMPLICIGFLCITYGQVLGTDPSCFISWEKPPLQIFFMFNTICFAIAAVFNLIILSNMMRVQSRNRDTVLYLKNQVKGHLLTSFLMILLWSYGTLGSVAYLRTADSSMIDMMPYFQIVNGWFGVILFIVLGLMSKRFRIGLSSQAEEKKKKLEAMKHKYGNTEAAVGAAVAADPLVDSTSTEQTTPTTSRPTSALSTRAESPSELMMEEEEPGRSDSVLGPSRPASAQFAADPSSSSRPASASELSSSRPASGVRPLDEEEEEGKEGGEEPMEDPGGPPQGEE